MTEGFGEFGVLLDHEEDLSPEPADSRLEHLDQLADVLLDEVAEFFALLVRMKPVLFLESRSCSLLRFAARGRVAPGPRGWADWRP